MHNRLIFRYRCARAPAEGWLLRGYQLPVRGWLVNRPTGLRQAMRGRRRVDEPRRWLSWGKRVDRGPGKSGPHQRSRRDTEPLQVKSLIPCCREKPLASWRSARTPNQHRWTGREYRGERENGG